LQHEIEALFGPALLAKASRLNPTQVDALAVSKAAGALLRLKGRPEDQIALVEKMDQATAAALCRWVSDPEFWNLVGQVTTH
jgi:hypothetical protein